MPEGFYADVCKCISSVGFKYVGNAKGSHEKWMCENSGVVLIVPKNMKSRHTANGILKDAGLSKKF
jgi:predicted RNA binding protein YcfA (HicA-like mRNA interferase family)